MSLLSRRTRSIIRAYVPQGKHVPFLILAGLVGMGGAFSALLFRSAFTYIQHLINANGTGMVAIAEALPWWGRLLLPMGGGMRSSVSSRVSMPSSFVLSSPTAVVRAAT
jgi:CIC family chloride channel protein